MSAWVCAAHSRGTGICFHLLHGLSCLSFSQVAFQVSIARNGCSSASRRAVTCLSASSIRKPSNSCSDRKREMQRTWLGIFGQWSVHSLYRRMTSCCTPQQGSKRRPPACCLLCITDDCSEPSDFNWWITSLHFCSSFRLNKSAPKASKRCVPDPDRIRPVKSVGLWRILIDRPDN